MTLEQQAELRAQARANPACAAALDAKDLDALAQILSVGRTRSAPREIGNGTVLDVLGLVAGNKLLDHIAISPELRHVKPLLEQGRLTIGAPGAQQVLQSFVALDDVLSRADADKLCALGQEPDPLTPREVADALYNPDGTEK